MLGPQEILLILVVLLLLFGPNKLPEIARSLGKMTGEFKKAQLESEKEFKNINPLNDNSDNNDKNLEKEMKIRKLAIEMGVKTDDKTIEQIIDEMRKINEKNNSKKISFVKNE